MASLVPSLRAPYKTVSTVPIPTDIYLPSSAVTPSNTQACPVIIMIHGGAFMLGHAGMNNIDQIQDCLDRGWIVLAVEHRLCPGVNILEGPMTDVRDALQWVQTGGLGEALQTQLKDTVRAVDKERVMVMGTSSGGHLALCTAWAVPKRPIAILDFYGAKHFADPFWSKPLVNMPESFYHDRPKEEVDALLQEKTTLIGGSSLEGHEASTSSAPVPDPKIRQAYAMNVIATGKVLQTVWPSTPSNLSDIDPMLNISCDWPPVAIVHGKIDAMIPMRLSKDFESKLREEGVEVGFYDVEGEGHTFCGKMEKGTSTWERQRLGFDFLQKVLQRSYGG